MRKNLGLDKWYNGIKEGFHKEVDNEMIKSSLKQMEEINEVEYEIHTYIQNLWNLRPTITENSIFNYKDQLELEDLIDEFEDRLESWKEKNEIKYRYVSGLIKEYS